jgi:hypothetical protein
MKKIIRLTESQFKYLLKKIITESTEIISEQELPQTRNEILAFQRWVINNKRDKYILGKGGLSGFGDDGKWGPKTKSAWNKYGSSYNAGSNLIKSLKDTDRFKSNKPKTKNEILKFQRWVITTKGDKKILGRGGSTGYGDDGKWGSKSEIAWLKYGSLYTQKPKKSDKNYPYSDLNENPTSELIATVIKNSKGSLLQGDKEAWAEAAFSKINNKKKYELVKKYLGEDPYEYVSSFIDTEKVYHTGPSISEKYKKIMGNLEPKKTFPASQQVKNQIKYLQFINFKQPFTIVDDINSKVYAVNSDFSLFGEYKVITGKDRGDEVKDVTFSDWFLEHPIDNFWTGIKSFWNAKWGEKLDAAAKELDSQYFNTKLWVTKNTPSGIFRAQKGVGNWLKDKILTAFAEKDYGARFIGWKTLDGEELAIGFHGTKNPERILINQDDWTQKTKARKGNISFGCINFKDSDIKNIDTFIKDNQYSFWLPDTTTDIVRFPKGEEPS